jgi:hypothetical protein
LAFEVLLVVLAHRSSSLAWVLCCFVWVWCFIAQVLWVHLCDFSVAVVFMFMVISMAFMFFFTLQLLLHCRCFCIVAIFASRFFYGMDPFAFLCNIYGWFSCLCVLCCLQVFGSMINYANFMRSARIRTFVFYFMFLFVLILISLFLSFFAEFRMLYVHCVHMFCVVTTMSKFL